MRLRQDGCAEILKVEAALWTFARVEGLEPTNNAAERALRPAVLWCKRSFGCHSAGGCRFVERLLSAVPGQGRQRAKAFGNGDWLANRFRPCLHTAARAHLFPGSRIDFVTVQGAVSSLGAGEP